eukprot:8673293-Prorocentrum_lima.AAC.1
MGSEAGWAHGLGVCVCVCVLGDGCAVVRSCHPFGSCCERDNILGLTSGWARMGPRAQREWSCCRTIPTSRS